MFAKNIYKLKKLSKKKHKQNKTKTTKKIVNIVLHQGNSNQSHHGNSLHHFFYNEKDSEKCHQVEKLELFYNGVENIKWYDAMKNSLAVPQKIIDL